MSALASNLDRPACNSRSSIRRVVRTPKRWDRIVDLAGELGAKLPAEPSAIALADFLKDRREADPKRFVDGFMQVPWVKADAKPPHNVKQSI